MKIAVLFILAAVAATHGVNIPSNEIPVATTQVAVHVEQSRNLRALNVFDDIAKFFEGDFAHFFTGDVAKFFEGLPDDFKDIGNWVKGSVVPDLGAFFTSTAGIVITRATGTITVACLRVFKVFQRFFGFLFEGYKVLWGDVEEFAKSIGKDVYEAGEALSKGVQAFIGYAGDTQGFAAMMKDMAASLDKAGGKVLSKVVQLAKHTGQETKVFFEKTDVALFKEFKDVGSRLVIKFASSAEDLGKDIVKLAPELTPGIDHAATFVYVGLLDLWAFLNDAGIIHTMVELAEWIAENPEIFGLLER